jgi:hypothetical protein
MTNHYKKCISLLQNLNKKYPRQALGQHLSLALSEYGDLWGLSDKEMLFALEKYQTEKELDFSEDMDINKIIFEGEHLFDEINEDTEDGY